MKKLIPILALSVFLANTANADQGQGKKRPDIDQIVASLELEEITAQELKVLMENHRAEMTALREQKEESREQHKAMREQHRDSLVNLLGYEKMYQFEEIMRKSRPRKRRQR